MIAKKDMERLKDIKEKIVAWHDYFLDNVKRYHEFMNFVFNTSLTPADVTALNSIQKPALEFNILEALISRLRGEFSKQRPSVCARAADGVPLDRLTPEFMETVKIVESHLREILCDNENDALSYRIYSDLLAGGFSTLEVYTDYLNEFSFEQCIYVERAFDPTLCGFDPLARDSHKGDGQYCFQLIPKTKVEFEEEFGKEAMKWAKFNASADESEFDWSYKNEDMDIVLVADFYEKKKKRVKICKLTNGHIMRKNDYERFIELWNARGVLEQPPLVVSERWTHIETIERYRICGEKVLEHTVTDFKHLPLIFVDGNSVTIRHDEISPSEQMTRPYVYHAKGIQQLKNFCGQTIAAEIENMVMSKFIIAAESIPPAYKDNWTNPQSVSLLAYNAFFDKNPDVPLPPPIQVMRSEVPQIVQSSFMGSDQVTQSILGSYDGLLGISSAQISGVAIQQGAMQSNAAAIPYLMGYISGLNRVAQIIVDLIPKFYVTPRSIPIKELDGKRSYQVINSPMQEFGEDGQRKPTINMGYDPNDLEIRIEAGPNAAVQKQVALDQISRMMGTSEMFANFINTKGLETIVDNLDIRGGDSMKVLAAQYMKEMEQKQQQAEQMAQQQAGKPDPMIELGNKDIDMRHQSAMAKLAIDQENTQIDKEKAQTERLKEIAKAALEREKLSLEYHKIMGQINAETRMYEHNRELREQAEAQASFDNALRAMEMQQNQLLDSIGQAPQSEE